VYCFRGIVCDIDVGVAICACVNGTRLCLIESGDRQLVCDDVTVCIDVTLCVDDAILAVFVTVAIALVAAPSVSPLTPATMPATSECVDDRNNATTSSSSFSVRFLTKKSPASYTTTAA
jgi:hypothetical protein